jgi:hypothetical protein
MYKIVDKRDKNSVRSYDSLDDTYDPFDNPREQKICSTYGSGDSVELESVRSKIENPKYVCRSCGRSTSDSSSLCSPEEL